MPIRKRPSVGFTFSARTGRYRAERTGRFLSHAEVRRVIDGAIAKSGQRMQRYAAGVRSGSLSVTDFEVAMRAELKSTHLIAILAAKGGRERLTATDYGTAGQRIRTEYQYLARFSDQLAAGSAPLDGRFTVRAASYAQAARGTYHDVERDEQLDRGFRFESNIMQPGDTCPGCEQATALGRVPIGSLPRIGSRDCKTACRCRIAYFRTEAA